MIDHTTLKIIHLSCVVFSISGFLLRAILSLKQANIMHRRWMRIWPHFIDTVLLISGLWMAANIQQYPFATDWLTAKLIALVVYVIAGVYALRRGKNKLTQLIALGVAIGAIAYIIATAFNRTPWL